MSTVLLHAWPRGSSGSPGRTAYCSAGTGPTYRPVLRTRRTSRPPEDHGSSTPVFGRRAGGGIGRMGGMPPEPHPRAIGSLRAVALDAPDIDLLATFYEQLAGWRRAPDDEEDDWITLDSGDGWRIGLQRATDPVPPRWPGQARPQQAHLDFRVPDIDAAAERAQQLGASLLRRGDRWHTLAD